MGDVTNGTIATIPEKKRISNHLSVGQWINSNHAPQQLIFPILFYFRNFHHHLVRYYWYQMSCIKVDSLELRILTPEGSLEVKLPAIWTDEKHGQEETRTWRKSEGRR